MVLLRLSRKFISNPNCKCKNFNSTTTGNSSFQSMKKSVLELLYTLKCRLFVQAFVYCRLFETITIAIVPNNRHSEVLVLLESREPHSLSISCFILNFTTKDEIPYVGFLFCCRILVGYLFVYQSILIEQCQLLNVNKRILH
ncbi:Uncharacterised protein [Cytobacillus firmus]|nr:Uncharacterised protein [Cytobacillus firmus]SUY32106.1 Uncharacterised protein [Cytobacillus firmus]